MHRQTDQHPAIQRSHQKHDDTAGSADPASSAGAGAGGVETAAVIPIAFPGPLAVGGKLRDCHLVQAKPLGLAIDEGCTQERYVQILRFIKTMKTASRMWLADAINFGRNKWGGDFVEQQLAQCEFDLGDANQAAAIASIPESLRHLELTTEHLYVIAQAKLDAAAQMKWRDLAVEHRLTALALKQSIAAGRVIGGGDGSGSGASSTRGVATIHGMRQTFDAWFRTVEANDPIEKWTADKKRQLWDELEAPVKLGLQLAKELGVELPE